MVSITTFSDRDAPVGFGEVAMRAYARMIGGDYQSLTPEECRGIPVEDASGNRSRMVANADGRCIHVGIEATSDRWRTPIVVGDVRLVFAGRGVRPTAMSVFVGDELVADADLDGPFRLIAGSAWRQAIVRPPALDEGYHRALRAVLDAEAMPRALPGGDRRPIGALPLGAHDPWRGTTIVDIEPDAVPGYLAGGGAVYAETEISYGVYGRAAHAAAVITAHGTWADATWRKYVDVSPLVAAVFGSALYDPISYALILWPAEVTTLADRSAAAA
ncbi:MAG: hypothetical protein C4523_08765 [Myxococcales bacterium]|nr:MAG: hypothetical protein C4523_08765 [Myxococcales bacterium]